MSSLHKVYCPVGCMIVVVGCPHLLTMFFCCISFRGAKMVIIGGDAGGNEGDRSGSQPLRRNSKRPANRQPRLAQSVEQGEDVEDADQFRVVKRTRRAALGKGAESSSRAAVAGEAVASSAADAEGSGEGVEVAPGEDVERPSQAGRIRASPARFANFNASLTPLQKSELVSRSVGGLLNLSHTLPADLTKFLVQSYQPQTSEMVFPGRGRICVDADSVQRVFDLPNKGPKVRYLVDKDATRRFRQAFNITGNSHPQITTWLKMIEHMAGRTDDTFFMAWLAILYLDALVHDIPVSNCAIRSNAWDSTLIAKVIKKDTISPGVFGKLQLKEEYRGTEQTPLFGGILQAEAFVASKLPITYNPQKKAKIAKVVNELCKVVTEQVGTFIKEVAKIDDEEPDIDPYEMPWSLNPYEDQTLIMVTGSAMHHLLTSA
ncbi:unnamed protein product [Triticum turgidum subsp. durum]|uniref:Uncharacterized protein n=2 Tax=Triticum TaxID=4564 RepID=A0A9R1AVE2_TRITD|nr:unnamed protein product [Triticum turgidum subsp. durum]